MVVNYTATADLKGKVVIVTGGSSGVGKVSCYELARCGAHVIIAARNEAKTMPIIEDIKKSTGNQNVEFLHIQMDVLKSVKDAADTFIKRGLPLHVLLNNAGRAGPTGSESITSDGFELTFQTNHLGPFLFTHLLLPILKSSSPSRIVNVSSTLSFNGKKYDWSKDTVQKDTSIGEIQSYSNSKLANVLHAKKLAQMLVGVVSVYSLHPGAVATDVYRNIPVFLQTVLKWFMLSEAQGAMTQIRCSVESSIAGETGLYYDNCKAVTAPKIAQNQETIDLYYQKSVELVGAFL